MRRLFNPYLLALAVLYAVVVVADIPYRFYSTAFQGSVFSYLSVGGVLLVFFVIWGVALRYRRETVASELPTVSVLIPVLNEERWIYDTLSHVAASDYPSDRLEIVLINDGSSDGTMNEVRRFEEEVKSVRVLDFQENRGKREALISGVGVSAGEVLVFLDSDTLVAPDAIRKLASSFDAGTSAICGEVLVSNRDRNLVTRIQEFDYFISFNFFKAFESRFGVVTCCPGCFSAIRRAPLMAVISKWTDQMVLGTRCSYGEDRFLTSLLLEKGAIRYQADARAATVVPETLGGLFRQRMRWSRSWFINSLLVSKHIWRRHVIASAAYYIIFASTLLVPLWIVDAAFLSAVALLVPVGLLAVLIALQLIIAARMQRWRTLLRCGTYLAGYFLVLAWLVPLSIATISNNRWGSRNR